jgi:hypothetical protein
MTRTAAARSDRRISFEVHESKPTVSDHVGWAAGRDAGVSAYRDGAVQELRQAHGQAPVGNRQGG